MNTSDGSTPGVYTNRDELLKLRFVAKDLSLVTRKKSVAIQGGAVRTRYRGRGMEFSEVRQYQAGDDIRTIDWRVTARMQSPYTKLFQEERERPIFVLVDQRSSMFFGSHDVFKSVFAAQLATIIAWTANNQNDRIGAMVFGDHEQRDIRAKRSQHAVMDLINQIVEQNQSLTRPFPAENGTTLTQMLTEASRIARPGSLILLLSDFHDFNHECQEPLARLAKSSDVMALHIYDKLERQLPPTHQLTVSNGKKRQTINPMSVGQAFTRQFDQFQNELRTLCINSGVQYVNANIQSSATEFAHELFNTRKNSKKGRKSAMSAGAN